MESAVIAALILAALALSSIDGAKPEQNDHWGKVRQELQRLAPSKPDDEWLRHLHRSYIDRFLSDNQRIWSTASILVPASLAAFPAFFATKGRDFWQALIFGAFSIAVMIFWHFIAEKHRVFQDRSLKLADAIEKHVLGDDIGGAIDAARSQQREPRPKVRTARIGLVWCTAALWLLITILALQGLLP